MGGGASTPDPLEDVVRSIVGRIALTVALSLGATGALVAVQAPAFANGGCIAVVFSPTLGSSYCQDGPDQYRTAIRCDAYNGYYSYWRYGPWVGATAWSDVNCWSSAERIVQIGMGFRSPGGTA
jgi:hypothetical protein